MRFLSSLLFMAIVSFTNAQLAIDTVYFDQSWNETPEWDSTEYYRIISTDTSGTIQFIVQDYYISGQLQMAGTYRSINPDKKNGEFIYYYRNGQKQIQCEFANNKLHGKRTEWYQNGNLKSTRFYEEDELTSEAKYFNQEGTLEKIVEYKNNLKDGSFLTFYPNGKIRRKDLYAEDQFVSGNCYTESGNDTTWFEYFVMPKFKGGGISRFKQFVLDEIHFPDTAKIAGEEGRVFVRFKVGKEGNVKNVEILRHDKEYFNQEALRVVKKSPSWMPGTIEGKAVDVSLIIPIRFLLK